MLESISLLLGSGALGAVLVRSLDYLINRRLRQAQSKLADEQSEETRFDLAQRYRERLETLERWKMEIADPELERCRKQDKAFKDLQKKYNALEVKYQSLRAAIQIIQEKAVARDVNGSDDEEQLEP